MDPTITSILVGILLIALGLLFCFRGQRLFRYYLAAAGFVIGYVLGEALVGIIGDFSFSLIVNLAVGIILAFVGYTLLYSIPAIAAGLALGSLLMVAVIRAFGVGRPYVDMILILMGLAIGAAVGTSLGNALITYSPALGGAAMAVTGLLLVLSIFLPVEVVHSIEFGAIALAGVFLLGTLGFYIQTEPATGGEVEA